MLKLDNNLVEDTDTESVKEFRQQPSRILIQVVNAIPNDLLMEISPRSKYLRKYSKVPLVMLLSEASL